jgi:sugar transferase (PEP-CTERM/EpsH1 system associated)
MNGSGRRRILHCVYSFGIGGLENMLVQLINRLPADEFEHTLMALSTVGECRARIVHPNVDFIALDKPPGHALRLYPRIMALLRAIRPDVVHTCNLAALEIAPLVRLAGVRRYIHAEHGWEMNDRNGGNARYRRLRRLYRRLPHHQVAVSGEIHDYLLQRVGVRRERLSLIANGVDLTAFSPQRPRAPLPGCPFEPGRHWLIGAVGRLAAVKNQAFLARAFVRALESGAAAGRDLRLVIVGDGEQRAEIAAILQQAGVMERVWFAGRRDDVPAVMRALDCFVLPSYAEGTSCTLQEAMASGLPVIATAVGGNPELVTDGDTGRLVRPDDDEALAAALLACAAAPAQARALGARARARAERDFDISRAIARYRELFGDNRLV